MRPVVSTNLEPDAVGEEVEIGVAATTLQQPVERNGKRENWYSLVLVLHQHQHQEGAEEASSADAR